MRHRIVPQHFCTSVLVEPSKVRACQVGCYGFPSLFFGGVHSLSLRSLYKDSTQAHPTIPLRAGVVVQTSSGDLSVLHCGEGVEPQLSALVTRQKVRRNLLHLCHHLNHCQSIHVAGVAAIDADGERESVILVSTKENERCHPLGLDVSGTDACDLEWFKNFL